MSKTLSTPQSAKELPSAIIKQMITLSTSGFGLVAGLAWNEVVKEFIETLIKPYLPQGSKLISLSIYAVVVTTLAVLVTLQLTRLSQAFESKEDTKKKKKK